MDYAYPLGQAAPAGSPGTTVPGQLRLIGEPAFPYERHRLYGTLAFALSDALALGIVLIAGGAFDHWLHAHDLPAWSWRPIWIWGLIPAWWGSAALMNLYPGWGLGPVEELRRTTSLLIFLCAAFIGMLFLSKQAHEVSRLAVVSVFVSGAVLVPLLRNKTKTLLIQKGLWQVPTAVYGAGKAGRRVIELLNEEMGLGYRPVAAFDDDRQRWRTLVAGVPVIGGTSMNMPGAPVAVVATSDVGGEHQAALMERLLVHYRTIVIVPDLDDAPSLCVRPRDLNGLLGLEVKCNLSVPHARRMKRAVDLLLVTLTAPLWMTLCVGIAGLIWLEDRANPFFLQTRIGKNGRSFRTVKFRTMVPDAEEVLRRKLAEDPALRLEWEDSCKLKDDPRVTRVGRWLRPLSLDELPQLINVIQGDMSLVGPRPLPSYHYTQLSQRVRNLRRLVLPGITGLWQVLGRSDTGTAGMERWDPYYVRNWSFWLDIVVLVRTFRAVIQRSGAY